MKPIFALTAAGALLLAGCAPTQSPPAASAPPAASVSATQNPPPAPAVATQSPPVLVEQNAAGTNAGFGRRRFRVNTLTFPPDETNRLARLGNRGAEVHDPSTIVKSGDQY